MTHCASSHTPSRGVGAVCGATRSRLVVLFPGGRSSRVRAGRNTQGAEHHDLLRSGTARRATRSDRQLTPGSRCSGHRTGKANIPCSDAPPALCAGSRQPAHAPRHPSLHRRTPSLTAIQDTSTARPSNQSESTPRIEPSPLISYRLRPPHRHGHSTRCLSWPPSRLPVKHSCHPSLHIKSVTWSSLVLPHPSSCKPTTSITRNASWRGVFVAPLNTAAGTHLKRRLSATHLPRRIRRKIAAHTTINTAATAH